MKRMKNFDVVVNFIGGFGPCQNHSGSLTSENNKLYSYNTVIAQYYNGNIYLNATKYSQTTSTIQNMIRRDAYKYIEIKEYIPMNTSDLSPYIEKYIPVNS